MEGCSTIAVRLQYVAISGERRTMLLHVLFVRSLCRCVLVSAKFFCAVHHAVFVVICMNVETAKSDVQNCPDTSTELPIPICCICEQQSASAV